MGRVMPKSNPEILKAAKRRLAVVNCILMIAELKKEDRARYDVDGVRSLIGDFTKEESKEQLKTLKQKLAEAINSLEQNSSSEENIEDYEKISSLNEKENEFLKELRYFISEQIKSEAEKIKSNEELYKIHHNCSFGLSSKSPPKTEKDFYHFDLYAYVVFGEELYYINSYSLTAVKLNISKELLQTLKLNTATDCQKKQNQSYQCVKKTLTERELQLITSWTGGHFSSFLPNEPGKESRKIANEVKKISNDNARYKNDIRCGKKIIELIDHESEDELFTTILEIIETFSEQTDQIPKEPIESSITLQEAVSLKDKLINLKKSLDISLQHLIEMYQKKRRYYVIEALTNKAKENTLQELCEINELFVQVKSDHEDIEKVLSFCHDSSGDVLKTTSEREISLESMSKLLKKYPETDEAKIKLKESFESLNQSLEQTLNYNNCFFTTSCSIRETNYLQAQQSQVQIELERWTLETVLTSTLNRYEEKYKNHKDKFEDVWRFSLYGLMDNLEKSIVVMQENLKKELLEKSNEADWKEVITSYLHARTAEYNQDVAMFIKKMAVIANNAGSKPYEKITEEIYKNFEKEFSDLIESYNVRNVSVEEIRNYAEHQAGKVQLAEKLFDLVKSCSALGNEQFSKGNKMDTVLNKTGLELKKLSSTKKWSESKRTLQNRCGTIFEKLVGISQSEKLKHWPNVENQYLLSFLSWLRDSRVCNAIFGKSLFLETQKIQKTYADFFKENKTPTKVEKEQSFVPNMPPSVVENQGIQI